MSLTEYIAALLLTCPHITVKPLDMHVDNTENKPVNYSIDCEPVSTVVKRYFDGAQKQYTFSLTARKAAFDDEDRARNTAVYEKVSLWMEQVTRSRTLPLMEDGRQPIRLEALDSGYLLERAEDNETGLYSMQCRLTYYEKARTSCL